MRLHELSGNVHQAENIPMRLINQKNLVSLILPVVMIAYGAIIFYAGDVIAGSILMGLGLVFYVVGKSVLKEKNEEPNLDTKTATNREQPVSATVEIKQRKAICPNCRSSIPSEARACPICGTIFLD